MTTQLKTPAGELRKIAEACARTGGAVLRDALSGGLGIVREKASNDFVTEVDTASEAAIAAFLRERRPDDDLLAEEAASAASSLRPRAIESNGARGWTGISWIVDPLDGTKNFIHGYPMYGVSVAARDESGLLAGAVYDPRRDEMFSAGRGAGATLNGAPIHVTAVETRGALVGTGFPFRHVRLRQAYLESFRLVLTAVSDVRRAGSAALDLAYVACGRLDGFWELGLSPWDMAAGWLLIEEAGGRVTDDQGGSDVFERGHIVAGGATVHAGLLEILRPAFEGKVEALAALPGMSEPGRKLRVGVVFGGRSGEHEVSLMSARSVVAALDPAKYDVVEIGVTREGKWLLSGDPLAKLLKEAGAQVEPGPASRSVALAADPSSASLVPLEGGDALSRGAGLERRPDVIIPLIHGTHGEDGSLQGLFDLAELPYVGPGVLASAVGFDKAVFKAIMQAHGILVADFRLVVVSARARETETWRTLAGELGYPLFVKPSNGGSSLGVTKVKDESQLTAAIRAAAAYDRRVLLERAVQGRELECAVLGYGAPDASVVGEVIPGHEFYDYEDKYFDDKARLEIPARIPPAAAETVRALAVRAFQAIDGAGMARVDFFLEDGTGAVLVNEINTIPGFTRISMYPKLWEASGLPFPRLLDRLILLALERAGEMRERKLSP